MTVQAPDPKPEHSDELLYEVKDGIGLVIFNRPEARNALTFSMYDRLAEICKSAKNDASLKAIIITGAGDRAFAAGTDISLFRDFRTAEGGLNYEQKMEEILAAVEACSVPTIAAISGACTGGGAVIAAACDLRIATADMLFGVPIARTLGNCLSAANLLRLSQLLGAGRTRELIFTARLIKADEAKAIGLVSEIFPTNGEMLDHAQDLARSIAGHAPLTLRVTKEMFARLNALQPNADDNDLIALCYASDDFREGLDAFLSKRRPEWKGR